VNLALIALSGFWALPILLLLRFFGLNKRIRFGTFFSTRIGHFCWEAGLEYANKQIIKSRELSFYWIPRNTANSFLRQIVGRNFTVYPCVYYIDKWNRLLPAFMRSGIVDSTYSIPYLDVHGVMQIAEPMKFSATENEQAIAWMRQFGWEVNKPFVTLIARDSYYLDTSPLHRSKRESCFGCYDYHSYRNTDIQTYRDAAEWLASQGVLVFRMGNAPENKLITSNINIIDYGFRDDKSDFLDIWLFANTSLCITTGTGPDGISFQYKRPMLFINFLPFGEFPLSGDFTVAPKKLKWAASSQPLTCTEYLQNSYTKTRHYDEAGICIEDLSPTEILNVTKECWANLTSTRRLAGPDQSDILRQKFSEAFPTLKDRYINKLARISPIYLELFPNFI